VFEYLLINLRGVNHHSGSACIERHTKHSQSILLADEDYHSTALHYNLSGIVCNPWVKVTCRENVQNQLTV